MDRSKHSRTPQPWPCSRAELVWRATPCGRGYLDRPLDPEYASVAILRCGSVAEAISELHRSICSATGTTTVLLVLDLEAAGPADRFDGESRVALWRACNRAWRVGVHVEPDGAIATNLLHDVHAFDRRRAERKARKVRA